jgi:serine/threonine protein kinase
MEGVLQPNQVIADRYEIIQVLGQGGMAMTYAARDRHTGDKVALKALSLRRLQDFKVLELFEREAQTLRQLDHPAIPKYLDYFQVDEAQNRSFYLVQQLAMGQPLTSLMERNWKPNEVAVKKLAIQVLQILVYLQQLTPPIIHRDIKPQNIICDRDGQVFLVDFGAVQDTYHNTLTGGSTVVGTYGYMAPEQFRGQAVLSTDLYGLGATLLFLLTGKHPADLPQRKLRIDFRSYVQIDNQFAKWLERMVDPIAEARFQSAVEALAVLRGERALESLPPIPVRPPGCPITLIRQDDRLRIKIPPLWLHSPHSRQFALLPCGAIAIFFLLILLTSTSGLLWLSEIALVTWTSLLVYGGLSFGGSLLFFRAATHAIELEISPQNVRVTRRRKRPTWVKFQPESWQNFRVIELRPIALQLQFQKRPITVCELVETYRFGCFLTEAEKVWLAAEVNDFVQKSHQHQSTFSSRTEIQALH